MLAGVTKASAPTILGKVGGLCTSSPLHELLYRFARDTRYSGTPG